jgi:hypothetical protein
MPAFGCVETQPLLRAPRALPLRIADPVSARQTDPERTRPARPGSGFEQDPGIQNPVRIERAFHAPEYIAE